MNGAYVTWAVYDWWKAKELEGKKGEQRGGMVGKVSLLASQGAKNWPFFTFSLRPCFRQASAPETTRSVWRQRNAGI